MLRPARTSGSEPATAAMVIPARRPRAAEHSSCAPPNVLIMLEGTATGYRWPAVPHRCATIAAPPAPDHTQTRFQLAHREDEGDDRIDSTGAHEQQGTSAEHIRGLPAGLATANAHVRTWMGRSLPGRPCRASSCTVCTSPWPGQRSRADTPGRSRRVRQAGRPRRLDRTSMLLRRRHLTAAANRHDRRR